MYRNRDSSGPCDPLYSSVQRFYIRNGFGEERPRDLRIVVDLSTAFSKVSKQVLHVQVFDDEDPFFFYSLVVSEEDYLKLKTSQGLLVDFDNFPTQVVRLLEQCKDCDSHSAKFLLLLEEEGRAEYARTLLKIVETNNFKHLCHLVLSIEHGSDEEIKKILVKKIKTLKEHNAKAEKTILSLESQLSSKDSMLQSAEMKTNEIERRWKEEKIASRAEADKALKDELEKLRRAQLDSQIRHEREKNELEEKHSAALRSKETEISKLRIENQILLDKRTHAEVNASENAKRIESLESELSNIRSDLVASRKLNGKLENDLREKERALANLKSKTGNAEQELKEKLALMSRQEELLKSAQEHKTRLENALKEKEAYVAKKQKTIQNVSEELIKANEIIAKLQKEINSLGSKLKTRTDIALEQEKVIEKREKSLDRLKREVDNKNKKLEELEKSEDKLKAAVLELKETLATKESKIKENEKLIDWLNRRCTQQAVQQSYASNFTNADVVQNLGLNQENPLPPPMADFAKTSTPLDRFKDSNRPQFGSNTPISRVNIKSLDMMETPAVIEEESENEENCNSPVSGKGDADKKTASPVDPPKLNSKPPFRKKIDNPKRPQAVPSSYFLK
ncbi:unnamed protein product [Nesidiocoris tenuis]|uniref:Spindle assembly abnormal protein 6 N-terminal domain-containing protein n=1 Tax=Nesidiocoris tenuis TaxID=355587 RepID=A0A6H5HJT1_9HEMI|nr:unnamed protein product [Nesidiocoris tenuis]